MAEETFAYFSKYRNRYFSIDRMKEGEIKGKTNINHLMAEDYGMLKERLLLSHLSYFFRSVINRTKKSENIYDFASYWEGQVKSEIEVNVALKHMKIKNTLIREYEDEPVIPGYFRSAFYILASYMEEGVWYEAFSLYDSYRASFAPIQLQTTYWPWDLTDMVIDEVDGKTCEDEYDLAEYTDEIFRRAVLYSWFYLFAMLGVFEIKEKEPPILPI